MNHQLYPERHWWRIELSFLSNEPLCIMLIFGPTLELRRGPAVSLGQIMISEVLSRISPTARSQRRSKLWTNSARFLLSILIRLYLKYLVVMVCWLARRTCPVLNLSMLTKREHRNTRLISTFTTFVIDYFLQIRLNTYIIGCYAPRIMLKKSKSVHSNLLNGKFHLMT